MEIFGLRLSPLPTPIYTELIQCFQKVNINTIHGINLYPVDNSVACTRTYLLNGDFFPWITPCNSSTTGKTHQVHPSLPCPSDFSTNKKTKLKMNGARTNTQAVKSLNCIFRLHFTAEP